jgi:hypothetical protein
VRDEARDFRAESRVNRSGPPNIDFQRPQQIRDLEICMPLNVEKTPKAPFSLDRISDEHPDNDTAIVSNCAARAAQTIRPSDSRRVIV